MTPPLVGGSSGSSRERRFYLQQFAGRTLVIAQEEEGSSGPVDACVEDLVAEGVRVVHLTSGGMGDTGIVVDDARWRPDDAGVVRVWRQLHDHGLMRVALPADADVLSTGADLAERLRAFKLVLLSPDQPPVGEGGDRPDSYVVLDRDVPTEGLARLAARALAGGVSTVNLCHPTDIAEELLTYAGAGTCFTLGDHTRVERVGIDDFPQVAELIERGVEEGYLKARGGDAVARLVVNGFGARVGDHHLAGFAALLVEPYAAQRMGEVCGLTTISRFGGGGVGARLVDRMLADAVTRDLLGVFACTSSEAAGRFFRRLGFIEVPQAELPAAKWEGYDQERRPLIRAFLHHLTMVGRS